MTSYTNIFGGSSVQPSEVSYVKYVLTADITLDWSTSFVDQPNVAAHIVELSTNAGVFDVTLPDSRLVSVGQDILFVNLGGNQVNINYSDGTLLTTLNAANIVYFYLTDNTTANGVWNAVPFGGGVVSVFSVGAQSLSPTALTIVSTTTNPINNFGTFQFTLDPALVSLANIAGTGIIVDTGGGNLVARTIQAGLDIIVQNGDGVAGDPQIAINPIMTGITSIQVGNMSIFGNTISTLAGNNPIILAPNGTGSVQLNNAAGSVPLRFYNVGGTYAEFKAASPMAASVSWTWPNADSIGVQFLQSDGAGNLSWGNGGGGGGAVTSIIGTANQITASSPTGNVTLSMPADVIITTSVKAGNVKAVGNTVETTNINGSLLLSPNGTGAVSIINSTDAIPLRFYNATGTNYVAFKAANPGADVTWTWPATDSAGPQFLASDGAGTLSWSSAGAGLGTVTSITQGANIVCTPNPIVAAGTIALSATPSGLTSVGVGNMSLAANTISTTGGNNPIILAPNGTGSVQLNNGTNTVPLRFYNAAGTNYVGFQAGNPVANTTWTLPLTDGAANQVLATSGAGVLSWATVAVVPVTVTNGGTGVVTFNPYAVICGGTTATNPLQQVVGVGTAGQVLTSNGAGTLPTWQGVGGATGTIKSWLKGDNTVPFNIYGSGNISSFSGGTTSNTINFTIPLLTNNYSIIATFYGSVSPGSPVWYVSTQTTTSFSINGGWSGGSLAQTHLVCIE